MIDLQASTGQRVNRSPIYRLTLVIVFSITVDYRFFSGIPAVPSITIVELLSYLALMLLFGRLALQGEELSKEVIHFYKENRPVVWYFAWAGFASLVTLTRSVDGLRYYKDLIPSLIVYFLVSTYVDDLRSLRSVTVAFLCGVVLNLFLGLSQSLTGVPRIVEMNQNAMLKLNLSGQIVSGNLATGLFTHPNGYALFLVPAAILIPTLVFRGRFLGTGKRLVLVLVWGLLAYNLWSTYGKVAYAFTLIGLGLVFVLGFSKRWHLATGIAILVASVGGITAYSLWAYAQKSSLFGTMLTRYELWKGALLAIRHDPMVAMFGNGFENMTALSAVYSNMEYPNAHNTYLNQVVFFGLPALGLYVSVWQMSLRRVSDMLKKAGDWEKTAGIFLLSVMIVLSGIYFFEPASQGVVEQAQFFALLAVAAALTRMSPGLVGQDCEKDRYLQNRLSPGL